MPSPPDDRRCRATTRGLKVRGEYWSPPKRCGNWAREDGYCWLHRPAEQPPDRPDDAEEGSR